MFVSPFSPSEKSADDATSDDVTAGCSSPLSVSLSEPSSNSDAVLSLISFSIDTSSTPASLTIGATVEVVAVAFPYFLLKSSAEIVSTSMLKFSN